jgi:replicative DNA helicase
MNNDINLTEKTLLVLAGRPGTGKTTIAVKIGTRFAEKNPQEKAIAFNLANKTASVDEIRERLRATENLGLVIIDYLQLIDRQGDDLGAITRKLKQMAVEFDVPVLLTSQLPRICDKRTPKLKDLGEIGQAADAVLFLHRISLGRPAIRRFVGKNGNEKKK